MSIISNANKNRMLIMARNQKIIWGLLISLLMLFNTLYCATAKAGILSSPCVAYHPSNYVFGPIIYRASPPRPFWTGWRYEGNCRKNCKVDRWSGRVYCCKRVCKTVAGVSFVPNIKRSRAVPLSTWK
jgi:hypothetical protein